MPLLLDLFCCEGGAAKGYADAGFDVIGVDIDPQPLYPYRFVRADALDVLHSIVEGTSSLPPVDVIHASPPCPAYSTMANRYGSDHPKLIVPVRQFLERTGLPWVIENVPGARREMRATISLHGGHFGLDVYRPRLFESNVGLVSPPRAPRPINAKAIYGKNDGRRVWTRTDGTELRVASLDEAREAMGMPWADWNGVREAIPPAYTEFIGVQLLAHLSEEATA